MHIYTLANNIFDDLITNLLSVVWILIEIHSLDHVNGEKDLNNLKFGTFFGGFWSDSAANMAVKVLKANS